MGFSWTDLIVPAFTAATSIIGGSMGLSAQEDEVERARADKDRDRMLNLQLEALRARYGGGGGGGGSPFTMAQRLAAKQNTADHNLNAVNALIAAYQNALK